MHDPPTQLTAASAALSGPRRYKFWPVYATAFTRTLSYTIYGIALPNYLIYFLHVPEWLYGVIISVYAIAYIAGPLVAMPITRRIGARNGTIISVAGSIILVSCQLVLLDPVALVVLRAADGFILGFFWPNLQMAVSSWQRAVPEKCDGQFFQTYGMSWNAGIVIGDIGGAAIVLLGSGNEYLALLLSWVAMITMLPCALAMERPDTTVSPSGGVYYAVPSRQEPPPRTQSAPVLVQAVATRHGSAATRYLLSFPPAFYLVSTLIYAYIKAFYPFVYPLALNDAGIPSYVVYLVTFINQSVQAVVIAVWTRKGVKAGHAAWAMSMVANFAFLVWLWLVADPVLLTIAFAVNGLLAGWLYTFTSRIMLEYGAVENSLKYATYYEFFNGIGFGMAPLIAGAVASVDPGMNFLITAILLGFVGVGLCLCSARAAGKRAGAGATVAVPPDSSESLNASGTE